MMLFSDTIGRKEQPTEDDIKKAIAYGGEKFRVNDLVKLEIDQDNYLSIWIGDKETGHRLEIRQSGVRNRECIPHFDSETAIKLMISYLNGNIDWMKEYQWKKTAAVQFIENTELLQDTKS